MNNYERAFAFLHRPDIEGDKLSLDPRDAGNYTPGGVLKGSRYGISARSFPNEDIANMTASRAAVLAKPAYWDMNHCDQLPPRVALIMLDCAYNQGAGDAARFLQRALNVPDDGEIGERTLAAVDTVDARELAKRITTQRIIDYTTARDWGVYKKGWVNRALEALRESDRW